MNPSYPGIVGSPPRSRKRRWPRILLRTLAGLFTLLVVGVAVGVLWLRSAEKTALPVLDGDIRVAGLSAPVTVLRNAHGVPHIEAATQDDLFMAQGYVTAQDRLWQMDTLRRNSEGTLAEILGSSLVPHDKMQRVVQLGVVARRIYANLSVADRTRLDDYARGVNLFIDQHADSLPAEFRLLHYRPQPWTGVDSIAIGLMMVQTLDWHWDVKLAREEISAHLHNPKLEADLYPVGSWRDHPPTGTVIDWSQPHPAPPGTPDDDDDDRSQAGVARPRSGARLGSRSPTHFAQNAKWMGHGGDLGLASLRAALGQSDCDGCNPGSNNWVISGAHTASGKPLLSNDMHLGLTEPNIWFMAGLSAPGFMRPALRCPGFPSSLPDTTSMWRGVLPRFMQTSRICILKSSMARATTRRSMAHGSHSPSTTR
jgi:penicillin amidase